ncbi:MAG TPA: hypothetical protein VKN14_03005 [Flavobacteriaceae bacterium]|nr:hypothetical protein [Flavobacteriaceae bacterium]
MSIQLNKIFSRLKIISLYGVSQSIMPIGQLAISYCIIKFRSLELWGSYVELLIWVSLLLLFMSFGNKDILLKNFSIDPTSIYQQWFTNVVSRCVLIIPVLIIIFLFPIFNQLQILVAFWLILLYINQSYQVLILYHKDFKFSLTVELIFYAFVFFFILFSINFIDLKFFILLIVLANLIKSLSYMFFYSKQMSGVEIRFSFLHLKNSIPFFIPLTLGTVRVKIDTYFANTFFSVADIGKYQVLISFLTVGQLITTYFVNPHLKLFYRLNKSVIKRIKIQSLFFGVIYGLIFTYLISIVLSNIYQIDFSLKNYIIAYMFIIPLLFQMIIINQIYRFNKQSIVSIAALITVLLQIIIGYIVIKANGIDGAIVIKSGSQWFITVFLWLWYKQTSKRQLV